ncbi:alpha/beta fold hydrolase [Haloglomus salinum]|uniref:alpha/beta fold hydrolase n=1 Tax=Haloglomus salinum TaxID=2962673 RepID=UPI0020CA14FB|nr:alpha/beta hydrolase [Haloglomus salinum]
MQDVEPMDHEQWSAEQEETTVSVDGHSVKMAYRDAGPTDRDEPRDTLVFVHGVPTWSYLWRRVAPAFEDAYRVIVPDMVGYGNSSFREGFDRSIRAQEQALDGLLDHLGIELFSFVAHDIGGGAALRFAAHQPERVDRFVASNLVCYDSWPVEFIVNLGLPRTEEMDREEFVGQLDFAFAEGAAADEPDEAFVEGMQAPWLGENGQRAIARAAVATNTNHTTEIDYGDIEAQLLCLWAEDDVMQPIEYGERLADDVGGEVVRLSGAYHWVPEDVGAEYREELGEFLGA